MRAIDGEAAGGYLAVRPPHRHAQRLLPDALPHRAGLCEGVAALLLHRLGVEVRPHHAGRGVHPADMGVEALIDEELAPGAGAVDVEALVALHLGFGAEIEAGVRVDQEKGVAVLGVLRRDGDAVGALQLPQGGKGRRERHLRVIGAAIEGAQILQRDPLDIAADAALGEAQGHPRCVLRDAAGRVGVLGEIEVQPVRPGDHQRFQPGRALAIAHLQRRLVIVHPRAQVAPHRALALHAGAQAKIIQIVGEDAGIVVLGLGVDHAEDGVRVGAAMDVGDTVIVPHDRHVGGVVGRSAPPLRLRRADGQKPRHQDGAEQAGRAGKRHGRRLRKVERHTTSHRRAINAPE